MKPTNLIEQDAATPSTAMMELMAHYQHVIQDAKNLIGDTSNVSASR